MNNIGSSGDSCDIAKNNACGATWCNSTCTCGENCTCTETLCCCNASLVLDSLRPLQQQQQSVNNCCSSNTKNCRVTEHENSDSIVLLESSSTASIVQGNTFPILEESQKLSFQSLSVREKYCNSSDVVEYIAKSVKGTDINRFKVFVDGMTCSMCSSAIISALQQENSLKDRIQNLSIVLATDIVYVDLKYATNNDAKLIKETIECIGYDVVKIESADSNTQQKNKALSPLRIQVLINGMTCSMCSQAIVSALQNTIKEIEKVSISLATDTAYIDFNNSSASCITINENDMIKKIKQTIEDIGYDVLNILAENNNSALDDNDVNSSCSNNNLNDFERMQDDWDLYHTRQEQKLKLRKRKFLLSLLGTIPILIFTMVLPYLITVFKTKHQVIIHQFLKEPIIRFHCVMGQNDTKHFTPGDHTNRRIDQIFNSSMAIIPNENSDSFNYTESVCTLTKTSSPGSLSSSIFLSENNHTIDRDDRSYNGKHRYASNCNCNTISLEAFVVWLLATPIQFYCGYEFYQMSYYNVFRSTVAGGSIKLGMDVLIAMGTTASYGYALMGTLLLTTTTYGDQNNVRANTDGMDYAHFFETSAVLISFVLGGKWMQAYAVRRTSQALSALMELQPSTAILIKMIHPKNGKENNIIDTGTEDNNGNSKYNSKYKDQTNPSLYPYEEIIVPTSTIQKGDIVKILRGESIPADGIVRYGEMSVDESMVTGESIPVLKTPGSFVLGGTLCVETSSLSSIGVATETKNQTNNVDETKPEESSQNNENNNGDRHNSNSIGAAFVEVTTVGSSTALAQIISLVQEAQTRTVPIQNFADTISSIFVPLVLTISLFTFLIWYGLCSSDLIPKEWYMPGASSSSGDSSYDEENENYAATTFSLLFSLACLVISCPCALGLATPTAVMVGTGHAAKLGILMKGGGETIEMASQVDSVIFDKTGTLTKGQPCVSDFDIFVANTIHNGNIQNRIICSDGTPISLTSSGNTMEPFLEPSTKEMQSKLDREYILWLLGSLERNSEHPLARAIVNFAEQQLGSKKLNEKPFMQPINFRAMTGRGCSGTIIDDSEYNLSNTIEVAVGNRAFFMSAQKDKKTFNAIIPPSIELKMKELEYHGKTAILGSVNDTICIVMGIRDELKSDAKASIIYLQNKLNIDVWMVTGDNHRTANAIGKELNLPPNRIISEALPYQKVQKVLGLQNEDNEHGNKKTVAMVGDGINDSPALTQANVGICVGSLSSNGGDTDDSNNDTNNKHSTTSAITTEAADIVILSNSSCNGILANNDSRMGGGNIKEVCVSLHLSRCIMKRIRYNFLYALIYNILGIPIAAGVLYPLIHTRLPPTIAALTMALSSISVVLSSLSLKMYKPPILDILNMVDSDDGTNRFKAEGQSGNGIIMGDSRQNPPRTYWAKQVDSLQLDTDNDLMQPLLMAENEKHLNQDMTESQSQIESNLV